LEAIYLLTDGEPTGGVTTPSAITTFLQNLNKSRTKKVKINTISFMLGGTESPANRKKA
jgi:hypothetical protein